HGSARICSIAAYFAQGPAVAILSLGLEHHLCADRANGAQVIPGPCPVALLEFGRIDLREADRDGFLLAWAAHPHAVAVVHRRNDAILGCRTGSETEKGSGKQGSNH